MRLTRPTERRLYQQVADQIRALIRGGDLAVGDRLPGERELALQLGVSRPSLREALIALEIEGIVEVRMGSGVYVLPAPQGRRLHGTSAVGESPLVLMGARIAEGDEQAVAEIAHDRAAVPPDDLGAGGTKGADDLAVIFGIESPRHCRRMRQIAEQDGELPVLDGLPARCRGDTRGDNHGRDRAAALSAESEPGWIGRATRPAGR